jgi:hypothetical protein
MCLHAALGLAEARPDMTVVLVTAKDEASLLGLLEASGGKAWYEPDVDFELAAVAWLGPPRDPHARKLPLLATREEVTT